MECLGSQAVESFQEPFEAQEIQYETFPSLERTPQVSTHRREKFQFCFFESSRTFQFVMDFVHFSDSFHHLFLHAYPAIHANSFLSHELILKYASILHSTVS